MSLMGTRVVRIEDQKLITSGGVYVDDLRDPLLNGAVHAAFVRGPLAHARILGVDVSAAREAPGVVGVFTAADLDIGKDEDDPRAEPWLAKDKVRYVGEPVALVLTEHRYQLADAAELVDVDYDPLPAVIDFDDALR
ncbi:MAG TPA: xanthine dehydrogenase family protein molybdopterin-binding subunit, partial [Pseudonocardiaceae bacterium]|nr:xanthine dehydrogenase family protein molybdopterin-binding subunit [Pseudonocardiaceae bacterium]